jgi:UDP-N-acetylmuramyl tripeptide synthase
MKLKKTPRFLFALFLAKVAMFTQKLLRMNASYFPGKLAITLCPDFLGRIDKPKTIIGVTGTNGKTTCCNLIIDALTELGYDVLNNRFGSNVNSGIASSLISGSTLFGKAKKDLAVFEIDERSSIRIFPYLTPTYLLCTNLFRDSLRRNAHSEYILGMITDYVPKETKLILNADDLISSRIAPENERVYFGIEKMKTDLPESINVVNDMRVCPNCQTDLEYEFVRYHHIGRAHCPKCGFKSPNADYLATVDFDSLSLTMHSKGEDTHFSLINDSIFNAYNLIAVVAVLDQFGIKREKTVQALSNRKIVETRFSAEKIGDTEVINNMAKGQNPIACSCVFDYVRRAQGTKEVIVILDDIHDNKVSSENICWLYDADFEFLGDDSIKRIIVGGIRAIDVKVRLEIGGVDPEKIICIDEVNETPSALKWDTDKIYILHDLYRNDQALVIRDRIKDVLRNKQGGEN